MKRLHLTNGEILILDDLDEGRWQEAVEADLKNEAGDPATEWIVVSDQRSNSRWRVAPADCGLGCRCAATGRPL